MVGTPRWVQAAPDKWQRRDGAVVLHRPANGAKKAWVAIGPNKERHERTYGARSKVVKYMTAAAAIRIADREWPPT